MNRHAARADWLLLVTAMIWGCAFVAQRSGMKYMGPFTFTGVRFMMGACVLIPLMAWRHRRRGISIPLGVSASRSDFVRKSFLLGCVLFCAAGLQQIGMEYTTAGKGGFITGLYVILVPVYGLFLGRKADWSIWTASGLATLGMYFLTITGGFTMGIGDLWVLASAFFWALHVMLIGWLSPKMDTIQLSFAQFTVCAVLSLVTAEFTETISLSGFIYGAVPLLYGGVLSVGIAYTLQVVAQKNAPPAHAAIIMSLETVFAVLAGWVVLKEPLTSRTILGCALMLAGMLVARPGAVSSRPD